MTIFGTPDPARELVKYPALHGKLKAGGWLYQRGELRIDDSLFGKLTAAEKTELETWLTTLNIPTTPRSET